MSDQKFAEHPVVSLAGMTPMTESSIVSSIVNVKDYGAVGDGVADDSAALQAATNTGKTVFFPQGRYVIRTPVSYTGKVVWVSSGRVVLLSDTVVLHVISGDDSQIDNFEMENISAPWIIRREPENWQAVPAVVRWSQEPANNDGYQPTNSDGDVWPELTSEQREQEIGPKLFFEGDASGIRISRITGRFVNIIIYDAVRSEVYDCDFRAGKFFLGGIGFWNINGQAGLHNRAYNNIVSFSSTCGVGLANNFEGSVNNNIIISPGESGIKFYQGDVSTPTKSARCFFMKVHENTVKYAYYDGLDLQADYGAPYTYLDTRHQVTNNTCTKVRGAGIFADGKNNQYSSNLIDSCGNSGLLLSMNDSQISDNIVMNCNTLNATSGSHQITVQGEGNLISGNYINQSPVETDPRPGYALYGEGANRISDNYAASGTMFFGVHGAVSAILSNNIDQLTTASENTMPSRVRQNLNNISALTLYSDTSLFDNVDLDFHPRNNFLRNPIARVSGLLSKGADGAENGYLIASAAQAGVMRPGLVIQTDDSIPGKAWCTMYAQPAAIPSTYLPAGSFAAYIDEVGNNLKFVVRYSDGVAKTGTVPLT